MENNKALLRKATAVFLAFVMVFALVPAQISVAFAAETDYIVCLGEEYYETVQQAVNEAENGETITLLKNANGDGIVVAENKEIIFDFGGFTYTVDGELVGSSGTKTLGMQLLKGARVTLKNGTLKAGSAVKMLIQNYSDLTVENFNIDATDVDYARIYALSNNFGNVLITGDSDISSDNCAFDLWYGLYDVYAEGVSVTFDENYRGTVTGTIEYGAANATEGWLEKTALTIENGTFNGSFVATSDFELETANIVISGGSFTDTTAGSFCEEDLKLDENGQVTAKNYIVSANGKQYETVQQAVNEAENGETITLLKNANGDGIVVAENKEIIFDFGGFTYTVDGELVGSSGTKTLGMQLLKGARVTLKNGTLKAGSAVKMLIQNYSDLTVENFNIDATDVDYARIYALSNNFGNVLITGDSDISSDNCAFDLWYGLYDVYAEGVSVTFDENYRGTVTGTIEYGAANATEGWLEKTVLTIENGTFNGSFVATSDFELETANIVISGGSFTDTTAGSFCEEDLKLDENGQVTERNYIVSANGKRYETVQQAVNEAENGETITLLKNANGDGIVVAENKEIIFDFGGFTYTVDGELVGSSGTKTLGMQLLKGARVTLKNGTLKAGSAVKMLIQNYSDLTVENFNIDATDVDYARIYALSNNFGNVLITGDSDISSDNCAFDLWYGLYDVYAEGVSVTFDENYRGTVTGTIEYGAANATEGWLEKTALTIENGTFNGSFVATSDFELETANIVISGGSFTDTTAGSFCEEDLKLDENGQVIAKNYIVSANGKQYETVQQAVNEAENGETITLLKNANGDGIVVAENKEIIFDFGGFTYTVDGELVGSSGTKTLGMQLLKGARVTLKNGTLKAGNAVKMLIQNYSDLTVENFNIDATDVDYARIYALSNNFGNVLITGDSDISSDNCAFDLWYGLYDVYAEGVSVTFDENYRGTVTGTIEYGAANATEGWLEKTVLTIENGFFDTEFTASSEFYFDNANINISGGRFVCEVNDEFCAEGMNPTVFDDGFYGVCTHEFTQKITDEAHLVSAPTCERGNVYYYDCAYCAKTGRETFDDGNSLGHSFVSYIYNEDATCTEDGTVTAICDREGCSATDTDIAQDTKTGHIWSAWIVTENATCTEKGEQERSCSVCNEKETQEISVQHSYSSIWTVDKEATCTADGSKSRHCLYCGEKGEATVIAKTGHSNTVTVTAATEKADGAVTTVCSVCKNTASVKTDRIAEISLVRASFTYNGKAFTPEVIVKDVKGNRLIKDKDYTVTYADNIDIGKGEVTVSFKGNYSGTRLLTFSINLAAVTGLKATEKNEGITLSWTAVKGAKSYNIYLYNSKTKKYELVSSVEKTTVSFKKLSGKKIASGATYKFRVAAVSASGKTAVESKLKNVNITTKPAAVSLTALKSSKAKQITVVWNAISTVTGYQVTYSQSKKFAKKNTKSVLIKKAKANKTTLKKLKSGKIYYVKVRAFKNVGGKKLYGAYSEVKTVKVK